MIDGLINTMEGMIRDSVSMAGTSKLNTEGFQKCVALTAAGWACVEGQPVEDRPNSILLIWNKEGYEKESVILSFGEQQLWLAYVERSKK